MADRRNYTIQFRKDTAYNWHTWNPTLGVGEPGYDTDANRFKVGDGVTAWRDLSYHTGDAFQVAQDAGYSGTREQWLNSLIGPRGLQGIEGPEGPRGAKGDKGDDGTGLSVEGVKESTEELPTVGTAGEAYIINGDFWTWDVLAREWRNAGPLEGAKGDKGEKGDPGNALNLIPGIEPGSNRGYTKMTWDGTEKALKYVGRAVVSSDMAFKLPPGEYVVEADIKASVAGTRTYAGVEGQADTPVRYKYGISNVLVGTEWQQFSAPLVIEKGEEGTFVFRLLPAYTGDNTATTWYRNLVFRPKISTTLISDGAVTREKIATGAITAESNIISSLDLSKATAGELDGARISTGTITADKLLIRPGNLFGDPLFQSDEWYYSDSDISRFTNGGYGDGPRMHIPAGTSSNRGVYYALSQISERTVLEPGKQYRLSAWVRSDQEIPAYAATIWGRLYAVNKTGWSWTKPDKIVNADTIPPNTWKRIEGIVEVPEGDAIYLTLGLYSRHTGALDWSLPQVLPVTDTTLIAKGAVTTEKIATGAITKDKLANGIIVQSPETNVRYFGAKGDGVSDDTAAIQNWFNYLSVTGGEGVLLPGAYRLTSRIQITNPDKSFSIRGISGGTEKPALVLDNSNPTTLLSISRGNYIKISNIKVKGIEVDKPIVHGISISNSTNCIIEDVEVDNYNNTAILFFNHSSSTITCENNTILRCLAEGRGIGRNGFLLETNLNSRILDCVTKNLSRTNTPSYGLQLKNSCVNCVISGGLVIDARAGVAFGSDTESQNKNAQVYGVTAIGCEYGFISSKTIDSRIQMLIDDKGEFTTGNPVRVGASCSGLSFDVSIKNIRANTTALYVGSSNNSFYLDRIIPEPDIMATYVVGLKNTNIVYRGRDFYVQGKIVDNSGESSNYAKGIL